MNKSELIAAIAEKADLPKATIEKAFNATLNTITDELAKGTNIAIVGFGTFKVNDRAARTARNPKTGETMQVAASKSPVFKAGKSLKDAVN